MNNKPVAFVSKEDLKDMETHLCDLHLKTQKNDIPLYTHPAKTLTPLTDEEIEIECRKAWNLNDQYRLNLEEVIRFAHAILRKAQEK